MVIPPLLLVGVLLGPGFGCSEAWEPPRRFALIQVEAARSLLREGSLTLVEVAAQGDQAIASPGALLWELPESPTNPTPPPEIHRAGVLLITSGARIGFRAAAAVSRTGSRRVFVFIPKNAEEKSSLYSLALKMKEIPRDRDS
jgi:hypothetical protein